MLFFFFSALMADFKLCSTFMMDMLYNDSYINFTLTNYFI